MIKAPSLNPSARWSTGALALWLPGVALAVGAFCLQWLEAQVLAQPVQGSLYLALLVGAFMVFGYWVGASLSPAPTAKGGQPNNAALATLGISPREQQVLQLLVQGLSNQEIAAKLFVANSTIKTHLHHLYRKLGVRTRGQAVHEANRLQLFGP